MAAQVLLARSFAVQYVVGKETRIGVNEMETLFSEWFWSQASAQRAADRMSRKGYSCAVRYAMRADGRCGWLMEAA